MTIISAIGGETVTTTVEGRERYGVNVRYARDLRDDLPALRRVLVPTPSGAQVPLAEIADIRLVAGPGMIRDENGMLAGYVYVDTAGSDVGGFVGRRQGRGGPRGASADRLLAPVERPVREHAPRQGAAEGRRPDHALPDLRAALHEHEVRLQGAARHARGAVLGHRRRLAAVPARLQHLDRGLGGHDRADGPGRRDRRLHAALPRPFLRRARAPGKDEDASRT